MPGSEVSGVIVELGAGVQRFQLGDKVRAIDWTESLGFRQVARLQRSDGASLRLEPAESSSPRPQPQILSPEGVDVWLLHRNSTPN